MRSVNSAAHLICFIIIAISGGYEIGETAFVGLLFLIGWAAFELFYKYQTSTSNRAMTWMLHCITALYLVVYPVKFALGLFLADQYWTVPRLLSESDLISLFPMAYMLSTIGIVSLLIGFVISPFKSRVTWVINAYSMRVRMVLLVSLIFLALKYYLKLEFNLAVPNVEPEDLGIPYLTGFVALVIHSGLLFVFNLILFRGLTTSNFPLSMLGFALAFANAIIDLRFGSKSTVIYQLAISGLYILMLRSALPHWQAMAHRIISGKLSVLMGICGVLILSTYRFVNTYRNALVAGHDVNTAISYATTSDLAAQELSVMEVFNRLIGIETLAAVLPIGEGLVEETGFMAMIDGSFVSAFSYELIGSSEALTKFSVTQFAYFFFTGGYLGLVLGFVFLGVLYTACQTLVEKAPVQPALKLAFLPILWIIYVNILMGGGNLVLTFKELFVVLACFVLFGRLACGHPAYSTQSGVPMGKALRVPRPTN